MTANKRYNKVCHSSTYDIEKEMTDNAIFISAWVVFLMFCLAGLVFLIVK